MSEEDIKEDIISKGFPRWICEGEDYNIEPLYTKIKWRIRKTLYEGRSKYQKISFHLSDDHGIIFMLDDVVMLTERDEFIYHEMLSHPLVFTHKSPKHVLVIGGGDLGIMRELIKHDYLECLDLCEIDREVVNRCLEYIPYSRSVVLDERLKLNFADGFDFLKSKTNYYDIIIIDSSDPVGEASKLFGLDFFRMVHASLKEDGLMGMQSGSPFYNKDFIVSLGGSLRSIFPIVRLYTASCHSYPGGYWGFLFGSKCYSLDNDFDVDRYRSMDLSTRYYNEGIHMASAELPEYIRNAFSALS